MGEVYRATDTKLKRRVAIKILPPSVAADHDRLARFQREAEVLASLNHPNIAGIYGVEESGGATALVMELVDGLTLAELIDGAVDPAPSGSEARQAAGVGPRGKQRRKGIPLADALPIAKQIAAALEAAHEQGIVHRDLKPANIKVRSDGTVKVLDFGLAKAMDPAGPMSTEVANSPTITSPALTARGMILGTAAYMSPEQARGKTVDKRADIWAFGAVLFEMLTGQRAFPGEDVTDTIVSVISKEPDWSMLPASTSPSLRSLLRRCLEKDPRQRVRDIGDVSLVLDGAFETAAPQSVPSATSSGSRARLVWIATLAVAALIVAIALAIPAVRHLGEIPPPLPLETRVDIVTPPTSQPTDFAISPDGRQIIYSASGDRASQLWLRSLATTTARPLPGTEGARGPFWSPDGRSIGFMAGNALKRLDIDGGAPQTLAPVTSASGATWSANGVIVFAPFASGTLMRAPATGGEVTAVTAFTQGQVAHFAPHFLPDGRKFLFTAVGAAPDAAGIYLGALDGSTPIRLTPANGGAVYLPERPGDAGPFRTSGWMLWVRERTLVGQRLDIEKAALTGELVTVADGIAVDPVGRSVVSVAATGQVAYRTAAGGDRQLTWVDRSGAARGTVFDPDSTLTLPNLAPDGRRVVVARTVQSNSDVWLLDGARTIKLTFDPALDWHPIWSPDGTRIVFRSRRTGVDNIYQKLASGAGEDELLVASDQVKTPESWSADGRYLLYRSIDPQTSLDLWVLPMFGDRTPSVFLKTPFREGYGAFSPDGRWVAYESNESGRNEIYIRPFVPPSRAASADKPAGKPPTPAGGQWQISTAGGIYPRWRPDGKELYYLNPAGAMMAAPIAVIGATLAPGAPVVLFPTRIVGGGEDIAQGRQYDVASDGRFLINTVLDTAAAPITLLQNWNPEAKK
jgi:serine/threonine protein kinase/Tol biopolymer transport system component